MPTSYQVTFLYDGPRCPVPGHRDGQACRITLNWVPADKARSLFRARQWPRWVRSVLSFQVNGLDGRPICKLPLNAMTELRLQPQQEVL